MYVNALRLLTQASASIAAAYKLAIFVVEMERYSNPLNVNPKCKLHDHPCPNSPHDLIHLQGTRYEMSLLLPPQFDRYGTTFWIPSQVEPTVALIGTSLPAVRQSLLSATQRLSTIFTSSGSSSFRNIGKILPGKKRASKTGEHESLSSDDDNVGLRMNYVDGVKGGTNKHNIV